jgi:hypothetical protein
MTCPKCKNPNNSSNLQCEWCGVNFNKSENENSDFTKIELTVNFEGVWIIFDVNVKLYADDKLVGTGSLKHGFSIEFNTPKAQPILVVKHMFRSQKIKIPNLEIGKKYELLLSYDRFLKGNFNNTPHKITKHNS